jgi:hypothetical protein
MNPRSQFRRLAAAALSLALVTTSASAAGTSAKRVPDVTHDGLELVQGSAMERTWVKPGEDFSQYDQVGLLDCFVAFKKNWQMDHPQMRTYDMDRIKKALAEEFHKIFSAELEKNGYPIATSPARNVLLVRPAIINLDVNAPDTNSDVDEITYTASAGSMTLYVEFYDSVSNEILARALDERAANNPGGFDESSIVTNTADARSLLEHWADLLVKKLDEVHGKKSH